MHIVKRDRLQDTIRNSLAFHYNAARLRVLAGVKGSAFSQDTLGNTVTAFNTKTVVLPVTSGRTGTDTLSRLLGYLPSTHASHEPNPNHRFILARAQHDTTLAARFFWHLQAPALVARPGQNAIETSHLFCKGFFEPCIAAGFRPALLILKRDARSVAVSFQRKNSVPGRTGAAFRYLISPNDHPYLRVDSPESLTDYQLCYWYCLEIELRQRLYSEIARDNGLTVASIETRDLNNIDALVECCVTLGLADQATAHDALSKAGVGTAHNASPKAKSGDPSFDPDAEEADLRARLHPPAELADVAARIKEAEKRLRK